MTGRKNQQLTTIFAIVFVDVLGFTLILPLLPFYSESLGATPVVVGALVSVYGLCQLLAGPVLGQLSDRVGRRPVLLISQIGSFAGFVLLATSKQLWLVFLARIIDGITAGNITVAQAYIADVTTPQERTKAMGVIGAAFGAGFILGPGISGILVRFGPTAPVWAACLFSAFSIIGTFFFLKDVKKESTHASAPTTHRQRYTELLGQKNVRHYYLSYLAFGISFATFMSGIALFGERRFTFNGVPFAAEQIGYLLAFAGLINLSTQLIFLGPLVKKFGERYLVKTAFLSSATGLLVIGFSTWLPLVILGVSLNALGSALLRPNLSSLISKSVSPRHQGLALGFAQTLISTAQVICPLIAGFFIEQGWFIGFAAFAASASLLGLLPSIPKTQPQHGDALKSSLPHSG